MILAYALQLGIGLFVLGLFIGTNLGVGLMCLLQINRPSAPVTTP